MNASSGLGGLSLRVSVTDRCQLRCDYCMPPEGVPLGPREEILTYEELASLAACLQAAFGLTKVRITGGEPLLRLEVERLVGMFAGLGVPDLALTTNGLLLAGMAQRLKRAGLQRVNVSLDTLSPDTFRRLTGGGELKAVLEGIDAALDAGLVPLKLNTVVMRGVNEEETADIVAFALGRKCEVRFIELMPIGPGAGLFAGGFVSSGEVRKKLSAHYTLAVGDAEPGAAARGYLVTDAAGRQGSIGFISSCSAPFCGDCSRLRVTADGRLIGCLASNEGISVRDMLRAGERQAIVAAARRILGGKTIRRAFEQKLAMASIGG